MRREGAITLAGSQYVEEIKSPPNSAQSSVVDTEPERSHNHNEKTNWFYYTVFHNPVRRWSDRTHIS